MYTCALLKYQNQTNCQLYHMSFSKFSTIVSSFWFFFFLVSRIIFSVGTWYLPLNESTCVSSSMFCIFFWQQAQCWLYKGAPLTIEILSFDLLLCQRLANLWLHLLRSGVFFFLLPSNIGEVFFLASRFNSSNRT